MNDPISKHVLDMIEPVDEVEARDELDYITQL